jgi:hypothetical protein
MHNIINKYLGYYQYWKYNPISGQEMISYTYVKAGMIS